jgi:hypothetical protein
VGFGSFVGAGVSITWVGVGSGGNVGASVGVGVGVGDGAMRHFSVGGKGTPHELPYGLNAPL